MTTLYRYVLGHLQKGGLGLLFALTLFLFGCKEDGTQEMASSGPKGFIEKWLGPKEDACDGVDVSQSKVEVHFTRLEEEIMSLKSPEAAHAFLQKYPTLATQFFAVNQYPKREILENSLSKLAQDTAIHTIYKETKAAYGDIADLEKQFSDAFSHIKHYYPNFVVPKIYTIITGLAIETFVSDSVIVLSLDYFLGNDAKYKPKEPSGLPFPDYILRRYKREFIVPTCLLYVSNKYNKVDMLENTLLAEMIYYGKAYEFVKTMMPCTPDSLIIGYTGEQLKDTEGHEGLIWGFFLEQKVLYETSHFIKTKYTGERPYTAEIGPRCPGKIGTWLGWRIIQEYRATHPQVSFPTLMETKSSKTLFLDSKYKPKKK